MDNLNWLEYLGIGIGILEIVGRAIPNPKITGPIGFVIEALSFISKFLNRERNY